mmetsp:Transcript_18174/g.59695  ORF Transcript_18174/g.59695 Transcript_18174/m.59695 type:complete len:286 (+) Transcript_18174:555-1412(+)
MDCEGQVLVVHPMHHLDCLQLPLRGRELDDDGVEGAVGGDKRSVREVDGVGRVAEGPEGLEVFVLGGEEEHVGDEGLDRRIHLQGALAPVDELRATGPSLHEEPDDVGVALHESGEERRHVDGRGLVFQQVHQPRLLHVRQTSQLSHLHLGVEAPELLEGERARLQVDRHSHLEQSLHHVDVADGTGPGDGGDAMVVGDEGICLGLEEEGGALEVAMADGAEERNAGVFDLEVPVEVREVADEDAVAAPLLHEEPELGALAVDVDGGRGSPDDLLQDRHVVPEAG